MPQSINRVFVLAYCCLSMLVLSAYGDETSSKVVFEGIGVEIPFGYRQTSEPKAKLAIIPLNGGFPTANFLTVPGSYPDLGKSLEIRSNNLLQSYRDVGLVDVATDGIEDLENPAGKWTAAVIKYSQSGLPMQSKIGILSLRDFHLILTVVGQQQQTTSTQELFDSLLKSVTIGNEVARLPLINSEKAHHSANRYALLALAALALFIIWTKRRKS